jgi:branched-subunit amino acid transport protein
MKKALAIVLIFGFVLVDFLFFHDVFKPGESVTFPQYLTGVLSIPVVVISALFLLRGDNFRNASASRHQARP